MIDLRNRLRQDPRVQRLEALWGRWQGPLYWGAVGILVLLILYLYLWPVVADRTVDLLEILDQPDRFVGQEVETIGFVYFDGQQTLLNVGLRTDDGRLNPVPLGESIWLENFPQAAIEQLTDGGYARHGVVRVRGRLKAGRFGPQGQYRLALEVLEAEPLPLEP